jgi:hypothetical protein
MFGVWAPRCSTALPVSGGLTHCVSIWHLQDMRNEMLEIVQDVILDMYLLMPFTVSLIVYLCCIGMPIQDKIMFVFEAMAWLKCHAKVLLLTERTFFTLKDMVMGPETLLFAGPSVHYWLTVVDDLTWANRKYPSNLMVHLLTIPQEMDYCHGGKFTATW